MSSTEVNLVSLSLSSGNTIDHVENISKVEDIDMTIPLTDVEDITPPSPELTSTDSTMMFPSSARPQLAPVPWRPVATHATGVPLSSVAPGPVWPTENQLKVSYGYAIRRRDGSYVQLIPADELHAVHFASLPVNQGPEGLIILPEPVVPRPEARQGTLFANERVPNFVVDQLPRNQINCPSFHLRSDDNYRRSTITSGRFTDYAPVKLTHQKDKVYCSKWLHDGNCAFVQIGCRYKHEMPLDKATQISVGLNSGLPAWYIRDQAVQLTPPQSVASPLIPDWRGTSAPVGFAGMPGGSNAGPSSGIPAVRNFLQQAVYGPIQPPRVPRANTGRGNMRAGDDDDEILYTGRN